MKKKSKLKKFFCASNGCFKVPYFWATLFLTTFFVLLVIHTVMCIINNWSLAPALGLLTGLVIGLIGLYNMGKKKNMVAGPGFQNSEIQESMEVEG